MEESTDFSVLVSGWQLQQKLQPVLKLFQAQFALIQVEKLCMYTQAAVKPGEHVCLFRGLVTAEFWGAGPQACSMLSAHSAAEIANRSGKRRGCTELTQLYAAFCHKQINSRPCNINLKL